MMLLSFSQGDERRNNLVRDGPVATYTTQAGRLNEPRIHFSLSDPPMTIDSAPSQCATETVREFTVANSHDVQIVVEASHTLLRELPLNRPKRFLAATAVSELARNLVVHAGGGLVRLSIIEREGRVGFEIVTEDEGPGIADVALALTEGYSTAQSLGLGLPGVKRMMDELYFDEDRVLGTRIVARKWA